MSILRLYSLTFFLLISGLHFLSAQQFNLNRQPLSNITYDKVDGYLIDYVNSMVFDENDWLWISGSTAEPENFKFGNVTGIIQRFNGNAFYPVDLPDVSLKKSTAVYLTKMHDNRFLVRFENGPKSVLYILDPKTIEFTRLNLPDETFEDNKFNVLKTKNLKYLCVFTRESQSYLYVLDEQLKFTYLNKTNLINDVAFVSFIELDDHYVISSKNSNTRLFTKEGVFIRKLNKKDLGFKSQNSDDVFINSSFVRNDTVYARFSYSERHFYYSEIEKKWMPTQIFKLDTATSEPNIIYESKTLVDKKGNILNQKAYQAKIVLDQYSNNLINLEYAYSFNLSSPSLIAAISRDLTKELIFEINGSLQVIVFERPNVSAFMKGFSIRSVLALNDKEVLVATDFSGWYILNIITKNIKPYLVTKDGLQYEQELNRNLFLGEHGIWGNDRDGITFTNSSTKELISFAETERISSMTEEGNNIYYGDVNSNLMVFNKKSHEITTLIKTDSLVFQDITVKDRNIFAATNKGLLYYNDIESKLYQPSTNEDDNYLLSSDYNSLNGFIFGSRSGKLYRFDQNSKSFHLIYEDDLGASIASTLYDDNRNIWINTFGGIVVFNPENETTTRYGLNDGLSHYEANRYSALKLNNGNFLVGTLRGLNYFNPDNLIKQSQEDKLKLTLFNAFDKKKKSFKTIVNPSDLEKLNHITLPASNRNMTMQFSLLGSFFNSDVVYRYRLDENDWIELGRKYELKLNNLASGDYTLEVEAIDKTRNKIGNSLVYTITAKEVFYKTFWFGFLIVGLTIMLIFIYERKKRQIQFAKFENQLLETELKYKQKDISDFALNISRNQKLRGQLLVHIKKLKKLNVLKSDVNFKALEKTVFDRDIIDNHTVDFQNKVDIINTAFYEKLQNEFPALSKTEVKLCSLIRLNIDNNEIAILQNVAVESVYTSRFRLRKKLSLSSDDDLNTFLNKF